MSTSCNVRAPVGLTARLLSCFQRDCKVYQNLGLIISRREGTGSCYFVLSSVACTHPVPLSSGIDIYMYRYLHVTLMFVNKVSVSVGILGNRTALFLVMDSCKVVSLETTNIPPVDVGLRNSGVVVISPDLFRLASHHRSHMKIRTSASLHLSRTPMGHGHANARQ
jgi:hypothetical protein